ncbi:MAG: iron uptake porin [Snowella sp.]|nr:iron uptake porin [Snowella sp.]
MGLILTSTGVLWGLENGIRPAIAQAQNLVGEIPKVSEMSNTAAPNPLEIKPEAKIQRYQLPSKSKSDTLSQVTSVSELRDVAPTEWAYEALKSLVERYGCIVGYPDRTFRGNRALSRWEFAAGLNACMNVMERLLQENVAVLREDIDKLRQLAQQFEQELAALGTRVDNLESRIAYLEDHQFSTTTKLSGFTSFYFSAAGSGTNIRAEGANVFVPFEPARNPDDNIPRSRVITDQPSATLSYLSWINFETSFTGKDNLTVQLAVGNGDAPANQFLSAGFYNSTGTPFTLQTGAETFNKVVIRDLFYSFPAADNLQLVVGPRINVYRYFDGNRFTFFINGPESFNSSGSTQFATVDRGSGAVADWKINDIFRLTAGYVGLSDEFLPAILGDTASNPKFGLFGGTWTAIAQLSIAPTDNVNLRLLYARSRMEPDPFTGYVGGATGEPLPYGYADDGFGGTLRHAFADTYLANMDWLVTQGFGIFGRYSYGKTFTTPTDSTRPSGIIASQSIQAGFSLLDFGKQGAQANVSYLIPMSVTSGREFLVAGGGDGSVQSEIEVNYFYPINNNIAIVPSFYLIMKPNNFGGNGPIYVGNLRTQFTF